MLMPRARVWLQWSLLMLVIVTALVVGAVANCIGALYPWHRSRLTHCKQGLDLLCEVRDVADDRPQLGGLG